MFTGGAQTVREHHAGTRRHLLGAGWGGTAGGGAPEQRHGGGHVGCVRFFLFSLVLGVWGRGVES